MFRRHICFPVQSDAVFAQLDRRYIEALQRDWFFDICHDAASIVRWMTAFDTTEADVDQFVASIRSTAEDAGPGQPPG